MGTKALPSSYSELFPNRFLKADLLKGQRVTLTIKAIEGEDLVGEDNKAKLEWLVKFEERALELVINRTNAFCMKRMWGNDPRAWVGKRITLYPTTTKFGRDTVDCIRVYGSPDIAEDMPVTVPQGRKKAWETVMHRTTAPNRNGSPPPATAPHSDPKIEAAFGILDWKPSERAEYLDQNRDKDAAWIANDLNRRIDALNE